MDAPHADDLRWLVSRYARLRAEHGEAIGTPHLVEPNGTFFPDAFSASPEGVGALLRRMLTYAPVASDLQIELAFVEAETGGGSCGTGGCGEGGGEAKGPIGEALQLREGAYRVIVAARDVSDPVVLAASLARSVGGIVLGEAGEAFDGVEHGALSEVAAAMCGFGVLFTSGACVYTKSCGGLRAHRATHLDVASHATALALFLRLHDLKPGSARRHLETTQREAFDESLPWVDSNPKLLEALSLHPESLVDGVFPIEETKGLLARLFGAKPARALEPVAKMERRARSPEQERRLAENKALVEQALRERSSSRMY
jgi:hypothetical protein